MNTLKHTGKFAMWATALWLVIVAAGVREGCGQDKPPNFQGEPHRVWTNEDLNEIRGGVSVVGSPRPSTKTGDPIRAARPLPNLSFRATTIEGEEITARSVNGRAILIQFWVTWCPYCRRDQSAVDKIVDSYSEQVLVLAVDRGEKRKIVEEYLKKSPRSCAVVLSADTDLTKFSAVNTSPYYVLISPSGQVLGTHRGLAGLEGLRNLLRKAGI